MSLKSVLLKTATCSALTLGIMLSNAVPASAQLEPGQDLNSPLAAEPTDAPGFVRATLLMMQLARPALGKKYLQQLLALDLSDAELIALREQYGTGTFVELTRLDDLNPEAIELLNRLNAAVQRTVNDPSYVRSLLPKLIGTSRERSQALAELQQLGAYSVPAMLKAMNDPLAGVDRDTLVFTMTRLGADAVPPVIGALTAPDDSIRSAAAEVLGANGGEPQTLWLWYPAYGEGQPTGLMKSAREALGRIRYGESRYAGRVSNFGAADRMLNTAIAHLDQKFEWPEIYGENPNVSIWTWSSNLGTVEEHVVSRRNASLHYAERLAREASLLAPMNHEASIVLLAAQIENEVLATGWNQPLPTGPGTAYDLAVRLGPEFCTDVLTFALDHELSAASLVTLEALRHTGDATALQKPNSPIIRALNAASPRVQFAAAATIIRWEPRTSFSHASRVVEIMSRALNADSRGNSVVMDPNVQRGTLTASLFGELGYDSNFTRTGMEGFMLAATRGDVELAVLHPNVIRWELTQTVANLRADARTKSLPIVIVGPRAIRSRIEEMATQFQNVAYIEESNHSIDLVRDLQPALALQSPPPLTQEQRSEQILEAAYWLAYIASHHLEVFNLAPAEEALVAAMNQPRVLADVTTALAVIGRPSIQERLLETATAPAASVEMRQQTAMTLAQHIQRFGRLLQDDDIQALRAAWENEPDPAVRTALAAVIGALKPTPQAARNELLSRRISLPVKP